MPDHKIPMICIFLIVATVLAFWQVNRCDFVGYDDTKYVTDNSHIQHGLTMKGIRWALTTGHEANWHPLTWISHMLDVQLFGLNPHRHHLTSLLFHIANVLLLFFVLHRMTKALWQSAFVAALFALHPLHVESVAWVAERKDVLSTFFWILTMGAYCSYVERPGPRRYVPVLIFFALGLMAKPMLVTLPFVLLLLDYWPLGRLEKKAAEKTQTKTGKPIPPDKRIGEYGGKNVAIPQEEETKGPGDAEYRRASIASLFWEKIPLFVLTILSSVVTYIVQQKGGAVASVEKFPLGVRAENVFVSYITYFGKTIWPNNLSVFYPYDRLPASWQVLGAVVFFVAMTSAVIWAAKRFPYLTVGWLWYAGTLVPVIGLVQVGAQARADRYTYVPLIGLFIMAAWVVPEVLAKWRYRRKVLVALSALTLSYFFVLTWTQVEYWQNSLTLFGHALKVTDNNYIAYYNRGNAYAALGNQERAIEDYERALKINPQYAVVYSNRGSLYFKLGNYKQAIEDYDKAIEINPKLASAYNNRGNTYGALGNYRQAITDYDKAIEIDPKLEEAHYNRGNAYEVLGSQKQAIMDYDKAIEINPASAVAYYNRGFAYAALGNYRQAITDYDKAIEINPKLAEVRNNRGFAYAALGNYKQAITDYDKAIEINPRLALAYRNRAVLYDSLGNERQAYEDLKRAAVLGDEAARNFFRSQGMSW